MDSLNSRERNTRKNVANILQGLGFKDTPESRNLDPWMTQVLAREKQKQGGDDNKQEDYSATKHSSIPEKKDDHGHKQSAPLVKINKHPNANDNIHQSAKNRKGKETSHTPRLLRAKEKEKETRQIDDDDILQDSSRKSASSEIVMALEAKIHRELRNKIMVEMGGWGLVFVIQKKLMMEDVSPQRNCRLSIPMKQIQNQFLEEDEAKMLMNMGIIKVKLLILNQDYVQPGLIESEVRIMNLKMLEEQNMYTLNGIWYILVQRHQLKQHMLVQLWAFRVDSELHFALVKL